MDLQPLSFLATLGDYDRQATELLQGHASGDAKAIEVTHHHHPRFLDSEIPWLPRNLSESEIRNAPFDLDDARLTLARSYNFQDWTALSEYVAAVTPVGSPVFLFESAVEAVITGELAALESLLRRHPELARARSSRRNNFDPPVHRATLLHYIAANGVEGFRQKTPPNAVAIARALLEAGAEVDALADMYGGHYTTMSMLVSSSPPAEAGLQVALVNTLVDYGAAVEPNGSAKWGSPLMTALAFSFLDAAQALVTRGARVENLTAAAGLGRLEDAIRLLPAADAEGRHRALALAAQHGHVEVVRLLLDAGEDPNRYNLDGNHAHSTPLHQAALAGHEAVVRLLVERGARLDIKDTIYRSTPLGWATYSGKTAIADYLRASGADASACPD
jgi:ankyrin repeat protein